MATIKFSNGATVNFSGVPTQKDIEEVAARINQQAPAQAPSQPQEALKAGGALGAYQDFVHGIAQGATGTVLGIGQLARKATGALGLHENTSGQSDIFNPQSSAGQYAQQYVTPQNTAQSIGKGAEQFAEYFAPASAAAKGEEAINLISHGISSPFFAGLARIAGKSAVQGAAAGAVRFAQTGGDVKASGETALGAGLTRGAFATIGEGVNALRLPERIYSTIFKNTSGDMLQQLKSGAIDSLQSSNPEKYQQLVDAGIIKVSKTGAPVVNESLARKALDAGLRGSTRNMASTVVTGALDSEHAAQTIAAEYKGTVHFPEEQFKNVLEDVAAQYKDVGFGEVSQEAQRLSTALDTGNGNLSVSDALDMRRLLDKLRISSSFNQPAPKLSLTQSNFKTLADTARSRVNSVPGMADVMKQYSFNIDALEALAKEAAARGNTQVLSLIDSIFLGNGLTAANASPALTALTLRKLFMTPAGKTYLGSILNTAGKPLSSAASGALGGVMGAGQSQLSGQ